MPPLTGNPMHLRNRAKEMRALAEKLTDPDEKHFALQMVGDYENLARLAEAQTASPRGADY
jgi:3-methyladenine DNA glycosylase AlkD